MLLFCSERASTDGSYLAYALLRRALNEAYGTMALQIKKTAAGKPYFPERPDIHFSISHTKTHVLCALSDSPVGVDIETIRPVRHGVSERVCSESELRDFDFFELWVLKESFIKLTGNTDVILNKICFSRKSNCIITPDPAVNARLYYDIPECMAAVCSKSSFLPDKIDLIHLSEI